VGSPNCEICETHRKEAFESEAAVREKKLDEKVRVPRMVGRSDVSLSLILPILSRNVFADSRPTCTRTKA
jgi:hypothetical protein